MLAMSPFLYRKTEDSRFCRPDRQVPQAFWRCKVLIDWLTMDPTKGAYRRLFLLLCGLLYSAAVAGADCPTDHIDEFARVKYVHDGDTVHLTTSQLFVVAL